MRTRVVFAPAVAFVLLSSPSLSGRDRPGGDGPGEPVSPRLLAVTELGRPDSAVDEDATGSAVLYQRGERKALHVHVRKLDPGTTYAVTATLGEQTEAIGNITTFGAGPDRVPRIYFAKLDGAQETPPVETDARGFASFLLNRDRTQLHYQAFARGLSGPPIAAHIHAAPVGEPGDIIIPLDHETLKGTVDVTAEQVALLASGGTYINIHTEAHPAGEIRGQIKPFIFSWPFRGFRGGSGFLRLDTERIDALPFGAETIADLQGMVISVLNGDDQVVLTGAFTEIKDLNADTGGEGGGGILGVPASPLSDPDPYFAMDDQHDASFIRGDANDDRRFDISDPVVVLAQLFQGAPSSYCQDAADANDDGQIEISDPIAMLMTLFQSRGSLAGPFPAKGFDPTADSLFCEE